MLAVADRLASTRGVSGANVKGCLGGMPIYLTRSEVPEASKVSFLLNPNYQRLFVTIQACPE